MALERATPSEEEIQAQSAQAAAAKAAEQKGARAAFSLINCIDAVERLGDQHDRARVINALAAYFGVLHA